jgi:2',3'-cyclic-nucleotide 2'-phosphodiesterase (5'-nucleotidase family)
MKPTKAIGKDQGHYWGIGITLIALILGGSTLLATQARPAIAAQETISTENVRSRETEAGNLFADAIRSVSSADIAIIPAAAFKPGVSISRPATAAQASSLVDPPSDVIVVLNLRGDQVLAALERSVSFAPQPSAGFLQVSGIRFSFDSRKESQKRVSNVTVNGAALAKTQSYKVATTRPLGNGQQGYSRVWDKSSIATDTGKSLEAALTEYAKGESLSPTLDQRITQNP